MVQSEGLDHSKRNSAEEAHAFDRAVAADADFVDDVSTGSAEGVYAGDQHGVDFSGLVSSRESAREIENDFDGAVLVLYEWPDERGGVDIGDASDAELGHCLILRSGSGVWFFGNTNDG